MKYLLLVLLLAGCEVGIENATPCTTEQLVMVIKYMDVCGRTEYYKSACFNKAVKNYCVKEKTK